MLTNRVAQGRKYSNEAALSLRSRRSGTKFAEPLQVRSLSADVFQGASFGILPSLCCFIGSFRKKIILSIMSIKKKNFDFIE